MTITRSDIRGGCRDAISAPSGASLKRDSRTHQRAAAPLATADSELSPYAHNRVANLGKDRQLLSVTRESRTNFLRLLTATDSN